MEYDPRMKICIVSDSHDRADALAQAVHEAKAQGAEAVIHCGDLIGAQTVKPALAHGLPLHLVNGNNTGDPQALHFLDKGEYLCLIGVGLLGLATLVCYLRIGVLLLRQGEHLQAGIVVLQILVLAAAASNLIGAGH